MVNKAFETPPETLVALADQLGFSSLDKAFMAFVYQQEGTHQNSLALLAGWVSYRLNQQDTCVDISQMASNLVSHMGFDDESDLLDKVTQSTCFARPECGRATPLIVDQNCLYLSRYFNYERGLADEINHRLHLDSSQDAAALKPIISDLFDNTHDGSEQGTIDWQCVAVCVAATRQFSLITGGPGTGKTTTVAKLLALLNGIARIKGNKLTIKLVAPTGKAAARLTDSIESAKLKLPKSYQQGLELQCTTIHRLLGSMPNRIDFKHHKNNPLHLDVLIVDEASMVDLPLMYKMISAVPVHGKIVLLGDHNQLSSVETGSVLSDIYHAAKKGHESPFYSQSNADIVSTMSGFQLASDPLVDASSISDSLVQLVKSYRFSAGGGVGQLAANVIQGNIRGTESVFENPLQNDGSQMSVRWFAEQSGQHLVENYVNNLSDYFTSIKQNKISDAFEYLGKQQILCAFKTGGWGTEAINRLVERELVKRGLISLDSLAYTGRPIMLSKNEHNLGLYNGDIGIIVPDPSNPSLTKAWFALGNGELKGILITRLPEFSTVYAMTIHKSQGSEFEHVSLCLPHDQGINASNLISRELLYTGLTRAKKSFDLYADRAALTQSLKKVCKRSSALYQRLA